SDDISYYQKKLDAEIGLFLSPWIKGNVKDVAFEGKMSKSVLLNFIEKREYVDYVTNFKMFHGSDISEEETDEAIATSSRTIFVSYVKDQATDKECNHDIEVV